jgi:hypothetical protein
MHISLRSYLLTGAVTVVGAGSLVIAPAAHTYPKMIATQPSNGITLAALDSPLTELLATVSLVNNDLFNGADLYGDYEWQPYQGLIPQFVYDALPILSQLVFNGSAYIGGSVDALTTSVTIISEAVWNLPSAVVTAAGQAVSGDVAGALTTLTNATVVPLQEAVGTVTASASATLTSVVYSIINLATAIPGIVQGLVTTTVGSLSAAVSAAVNIGSQTLTALSTLNVQTAWNVVVDGLLGPVGADGTIASSLPGTIEAVTIGPGLVPLGNPNGYAVPSVRMWAEQSKLQIANAIGGSYPVPAAAARTAARSAAAVTVPQTAKAVKHRASRQADRHRLDPTPESAR